MSDLHAGCHEGPQVLAEGQGRSAGLGRLEMRRVDYQHPGTRGPLSGSHEDWPEGGGDGGEGGGGGSGWVDVCG